MLAALILLSIPTLRAQECTPAPSPTFSLTILAPLPEVTTQSDYIQKSLELKLSSEIGPWKNTDIYAAFGVEWYDYITSFDSNGATTTCGAARRLVDPSIVYSVISTEALQSPDAAFTYAPDNFIYSGTACYGAGNRKIESLEVA